MTSMKKLSRAVELSNSMLSAAETGDWEKVSQIESQRMPLLKAAFPVQGSEARMPGIEQKMRQILVIDERIKVLAESARKALGRSAGKLSQGRQMARAYKSVRDGG